MISIKKRLKNGETSVIYISSSTETTVGTTTTVTPISTSFVEKEDSDFDNTVTEYLTSNVAKILVDDRDARELMYTKVVELRGLTDVPAEVKTNILDTIKRASIKHNPNSKEEIFEISAVSLSNITSYRVDITNEVLRRGNTAENKIVIPVRLLHQIILTYTETEISAAVISIMDLIVSKVAEYLYGPIDAQYMPSDTVIVPVLVEDPAPVVTPEEPVVPPTEPPVEETPIV